MTPQGRRLYIYVNGDEEGGERPRLGYGLGRGRGSDGGGEEQERGEGGVDGNRRTRVPMRALTPAAPNSPIALKAGKSVKPKNFD